MCAAIPLLFAGCGPYSDGEGGTTRTVVTTIAEGLNNPTSLLVQADGGLVVVESGAGRIVTLSAEGDIATLIEGFTLGTYTPFDIGPLSLAVAADGSLIVGEGGNPAGQERVSFYTAEGAQAGDPIVPVGGSDFFDVAVEPASGNLYIASAGTDRIFVAAVAAAGGYGEPETFVADTKADPIGAAAPTALAFDADGHLLAGFSDTQGGAIVALDTSPAAESVVVERVTEADGSVTSIVVRDSDGAILFTELGSSGSGSVHVLDADGNLSTLISGLDGPVDLALDADETVYVALLGGTPNAGTGRIATITIEIIEDATSNGVAEEGEETVD